VRSQLLIREFALSVPPALLLVLCLTRLVGGRLRLSMAATIAQVTARRNRRPMPMKGGRSMPPVVRTIWEAEASNAQRHAVSGARAGLTTEYIAGRA